jgi:hypothetical protein
MPVVVNYPPPSSVVVNEVTGAVTVVQSGRPGAQGEQGVVTATSPATYDAPTQTVGVDQTAIAIQPSQVAGTAVVDSDTRLLPAGGTTGQVLAKASSTNFDTTWVNRVAPAVLVGGGGNATNFPSATHQAGLAITGDIDIRVRGSIGSTSAFHSFAAKDEVTSQRCWAFANTNLGFPQFRWSTDGTSGAYVTVTGGTAFAAGAGVTAWFRVTLDVDNGAGGYEVKFWEAADQPDEPTSWTQVGSTSTGGSTTSIFAGTDALRVGAWNAGNVFSAGTFRRMTLRNGIGGTVVADWRSDIPVLRYNDGLGNVFAITGTGYSFRL